MAPSRSIAARERRLRASARSEIRCTPQASKAWRSISSLASVLIPVPWASGDSQVRPISAASGTAVAGSPIGPAGSGGQTTGPCQ